MSRNSHGGIFKHEEDNIIKRRKRTNIIIALIILAVVGIMYKSWSFISSPSSINLGDGSQDLESSRNNLVFSEGECSSFCTTEYAPVCGSNGVSYSNECRLKLAACRSKNDITVKHAGNCNKNDDPDIEEAPLPRSRYNTQ